MAARPRRRTPKIRTKPRDPIRDAIDYGIDIGAIKDNLALTPTERLRRHQIALNTVEMLQKAKRI